MREIALHIFDLLENSVRAHASEVTLTVAELINEDRYEVTIADNGDGISPTLLPRVTDPFYTTRTTRKVGMGLPLAKMCAEQAGGGLTITSKEGVGTTLHMWFQRSHWDCPPLGDIDGAVALFFSTHPTLHLIYICRNEQEELVFDSGDIMDILEGRRLDQEVLYRVLLEALREGRHPWNGE